MNLRSISFFALVLVGSLTFVACDKGEAEKGEAEKGKADDEKADAKAAEVEADESKADDAKADDAKAEESGEGDAKADDTAAAPAEGTDETGEPAGDEDTKADDKKADDKKSDDKKSDDKKADDKKADDKTAKVDAADLFSKKCKSCHGATGNAKTKLGEKHSIPDWTQAGWKAKWPKAKVVAVITNGEPGTKMKPFKDKLSKEEIDALADYSRKLGK